MPEIKTDRNQAAEWARLLAAALVVFLHVPFPGKTGEIVSCLARLAVPFFFALSGFYSLGADGGTLKKRLLRLLRLNLSATALYAFWGCFKAVYWGGTVTGHLLGMFPDAGPLWRLLVLHVNPFAGHLWYLTALMCCDFVLWLWVRFGKGRGYGCLYGLGAGLLVVFFLLSTVLPGKVHYYYYRNGFLLGLPVFLLGLFLREYGRHCRLKGRQLLLAALAGVILSLTQTRLFGPTELPVGALMAVAALLLWLKEHPWLPCPRMAALAGYLGRVSTAVYVMHLLVLEAWEMTLQPRLGEAEPWLRPIAVLGLSLAAAALWTWVGQSAGRKTKQER